MVYSTNLQKINFKYFVFWATQKWQKCGSDCAYFRNFNFDQILLFLYNSGYKVFKVNILNICGIHYWLQPEFFNVFETYKYFLFNF